MQKARLVAEHLSQKTPSIIWKAAEGGRGEKFSAYYEGGIIHIEGESYLAAAYGVSQASMGIRSGHIAEFLGEVSPHFPLRPLWVGGTYHLFLSEGWGISLPSLFSRQDFTLLERWCQRLIELGFNAIILGSRDHLPASHFQKDEFNLEKPFSILNDYGIQIILKPSLFSHEVGHCPLDPVYKAWLTESLKRLIARFSSVDFLFWESFYLHPSFTKHCCAKDATLAEIVLEEAKTIESVLSIPLIFYLPVPHLMFAQQQASWMLRLCDDVGKKTLISFPAVAGNLFGDHLPPHPFWDHLRKCHDISATRLLPIMNIGSVLQGEGLWPALSLDILEAYFSRLYRHCFAGAITLINFLPCEGSFLDCSLWIASQCLWRHTSPYPFVETWFRAHRPEWDFPFAWDILRSSRQIIVELSFLKSLTNEMSRDSISIEECRTMTESLLSRLKNLQMRVEKIERKSPKKIKSPTLSDYLSFFVRDAQRTILYFLQCFNLSYPHLFNDQDLQEGFWTEIVSKSGQGLRSGTKVTFFEEPQRGPVGSKMETIFLENRFN